MNGFEAFLLLFVILLGVSAVGVFVTFLIVWRMGWLPGVKVFGKSNGDSSK